MSPITTYILLAVIIVYALAILVELIFVRAVKRFALQAAILLGVVALLKVTTDFPTIRQPFGGVSSIISIGMVFFCTFLGITVRYFFYLKGQFLWREYLKPMLISPIVLLPLIGLIQKNSNIGANQLIYLSCLAFQNGFFWKVILEHAKK